uniref:E3A3 gp19.3k n=1 Tax=Human adenovirus D serotype 8 TaxID=31545 RepID=Q76EL7_ADE08|nr:E3A3 gp19.3k [Human adenovirus D8]
MKGLLLIILSLVGGHKPMKCSHHASVISHMTFKNKFETESVIPSLPWTVTVVVMLISWFPVAYHAFTHGTVFKCNVERALMLAFNNYCTYNTSSSLPVDITLHVARLHGLWPPTKENMVGFSLAFVIMACFMSGLLVGALMWFLKCKPRYGNEHKEKLL